MAKSKSKKPRGRVIKIPASRKPILDGKRLAPRFQGKITGRK